MGISGWYIILLTLSSSTQLAARLENIDSQISFECVRGGELCGWKAFSALVVYLQILVQWLAAVSLLAVYIAFRQHPSAEKTDHADAADVTTPLLFASANNAQQPLHDDHVTQQQEAEDMEQHFPPSNTAILAIVCTHAALIIPICLAVLIIGRPKDDDWGFLIDIFQSAFNGWFLAPSGLLFALASAVPQVHLMVTRSRVGMGLGGLSVLSVGLQALAFAALAVSQGLRLGWPHINYRNDPPITVLEWFLVVGGPAVGFGALAVCQLVVLAVALGVRASRRAVRL